MSILSSSNSNGHDDSMPEGSIELNGSSSANQITIIGPGTTIEGGLETNHNVRLSGTLSGHLKVDGKVLLSKSGHLDGNVRAATADLAGQVDGDIEISDLLVLRSSAVVRGDIHTENIIMEEGAQFSGKCYMGGGNGPLDAENDKKEDQNYGQFNGSTENGQTYEMEENSELADPQEA